MSTYTVSCIDDGIIILFMCMQIDVCIGIIIVIQINRTQLLRIRTAFAGHH